jgi:hypothetical protein
VVRRPPSGPADYVVVNGNQRAQDLALDANGDAVVACGGPGAFGADAKVLRFNRSGASTTVASSGLLSGTVGGPEAIAVEHTGTIVVTRRGLASGGGSTVSFGDVVRIDPVDQRQHMITGGLNNLAEPVALAMAADGTILYSGGRGLFTVHPQTGALTQLSTVANARIAVVPPLATP